MQIPHTQLSESALRGVLRDFVTRDGTDYGAAEATLDRKIADVLRLLERGEAAIDFDPATQSVTVVTVKPGRTREP